MEIHLSSHLNRPQLATKLLLTLSGKQYTYTTLANYLGVSRTSVKSKVESRTTKDERMNSKLTGVPIDVFPFFFWCASERGSDVRWVGFRPTHGGIYMIGGKPYTTHEAVNDLSIPGIRNFWLIKCQRCKEENLSQRII